MNTITVSRQRQWQLLQKEKGNCQICTKPSQFRALCDECTKRKHGTKYRKPLKSDWATVDWQESNKAIAERFGVTTVAVVYQRKKHDKLPPRQ